MERESRLDSSGDKTGLEKDWSGMKAGLTAIL